MKKRDLVAGKHILKFRNGEIGVVFNEGYFKINNFTYSSALDIYDEKLLNKYCVESDLDVVAIGKCHNSNMNDLLTKFDFGLIDWIWERKEVKEMTVAEIEEALGYSVKVVK